uniref:vesicle-fusing ATPase n=1 Tax=Henneguya salminicola TaxID=69463 RepID=A0A6G3MHB2_HENSL
MSEDFLKKAIDTITQATEEDNKGKYESALNLYCHGIELFRLCIKYEVQKGNACNAILAKCDEYLNRAEEIKKFLNEKKNKQPVAEGGTSKCKNDDNEESKRLKNQLKCAKS